MQGNQLTIEHVDKLRWFAQNSGNEVPYSSLDQLRLVSGPKGIYKPASMEYALSIRQVLGSKYNDGKVDWLGKGVWRFDYAQEGAHESDLNRLFTNRVS